MGDATVEKASKTERNEPLTADSQTLHCLLDIRLSKRLLAMSEAEWINALCATERNAQVTWP